MELNQDIFVRLLIGAFGLTFVAFMIRGIGTLVVGAETAQLISAPVFIIAILCAVAGFVLAVVIKLQSIVRDEPTA